MAKIWTKTILDSEEMAEARRRELDIARGHAISIAQTTLQACRDGFYRNRKGLTVELEEMIRAAREGKRSISPEDSVAVPSAGAFSETKVQVANETTLGASRRLTETGLRPLALNFANGIAPGGGFLHGARAQEEVLCRSSALYETLAGDPMYSAHRARPSPDSTDWVIYSPAVPVFVSDAGEPLDQLWPLSFITCAAPYVPGVGKSESAFLLGVRIRRVLAVARSLGYQSLVLGAWGCGAFGNDPRQTAADFLAALKSDHEGAFSDIVFAITDWSPERRFLGPFRDVFSAGC